MRKNLRGSIAREDIYKVDRVVSRDLSRARRRAQRDLTQHAQTKKLIVSFPDLLLGW
jgi:hypothetical protein